MEVIRLGADGLLGNEPMLGSWVKGDWVRGNYVGITDVGIFHGLTMHLASDAHDYLMKVERTVQCSSVNKIHSDPATHLA